MAFALPACHTAVRSWFCRAAFGPGRPAHPSRSTSRASRVCWRNAARSTSCSSVPVATSSRFRNRCTSGCEKPEFGSMSCLHRRLRARITCCSPRVAVLLPHSLRWTSRLLKNCFGSLRGGPPISRLPEIGDPRIPQPSKVTSVARAPNPGARSGPVSAVRTRRFAAPRNDASEFSTVLELPATRGFNENGSEPRLGCATIWTCRKPTLTARQ